MSGTSTSKVDFVVLLGLQQEMDICAQFKSRAWCLRRWRMCLQCPSWDCFYSPDFYRTSLQRRGTGDCIFQVGGCLQWRPSRLLSTTWEDHAFFNEADQIWPWFNELVHVRIIVRPTKEGELCCSMEASCCRFGNVLRTKKMATEWKPVVS